eukprot:m.563854 g.563854  ORF g.563854 m.563854 type:complete len:55 (+) comp22235_c4_seq11:3636-3800(+)
MQRVPRVRENREKLSGELRNNSTGDTPITLPGKSIKVCVFKILLCKMDTQNFAE